MRKALLSIYRRAVDVEQEQGVSTLFLALGALCWFETDESEVERRAPLLLLPVNMERQSAKSSFRLVPRDQDLETNYSLQGRLHDNFGLHLPDLPDGDDWLPSTYCKRVAECIADYPRWRVIEDSFVLDCFSFARFLMWKDLESLPVAEHPLLAPLLSGHGLDPDPGEPRLDATGPASLDLDYPDPETATYILDADSSQTRVIEAVRDGGHLAIQGPPGTGKSQTIANIIAAAVADGRRVLFVAEKKVALDVVHERLEKAGLGHLCLELHSSKANRKAVYGDLGDAMDWMATSGPQANRATYAEWETLRTELNRDDDCMHRVDEQSGATPYIVMGRIGRLERKGIRALPPDCGIRNADRWDADACGRWKAAAERLVLYIREYGLPSKHPWAGVTFAERPTPMDRGEWLACLEQAGRKLDALLDVIGALTPAFGPCRNNREAQALLARLNDIPDPVWAFMGNDAVVSGFGQVRDLCGTILHWQGARRLLRERVRPEHADDEDWAELHATLQERGATLLRFLDRKYWRCLYDVNERLTEPVPSLPGGRLRLLREMVDQQARAREVDARGDLGASVWGDAWNGVHTNIDPLDKALRWVDGQADTPAEIRSLVAAMPKDPARRAGQLDRALSEWEDAWRALAQAVDMDPAAVFGRANMPAVAHARVRDVLERWRTHMDDVDGAYWLQDARRTLDGTDLEDFGAALAEGRMAPDTANDLLDFAFATATWKRMRNRDPRLGRIRGSERSGRVGRFQALDDALPGVKACEIAGLYRGRLPTGMSGQMGLLRGEIAKKMRHMRIRRLLREAGDAVAGIKPVFMMSPVSVAQYLHPQGLRFDLLLVDEASQVRPEAALGSILRASQIVVVGDQKQLPPTRFFERQTHHADGQDEDGDSALLSDQVADMESILGLCEARGMPQGMLRWHYRSRHPSLIRVSNERFYGDNLFIPPSPQADSGPHLGMKFEFVGGSYKDRRNRKEAGAVVDGIALHARTCPHLSLGVAALSLRQKELVQDLLEHRRRQDQALDDFCRGKRSDDHMPVFVKNLENVQGDERDVVFVSVGYGPDEDGKIHQRFGPIGMPGGERRLNVLFTRSRVRCVVYASMRHGDIRLQPSTPTGTRILKTFLQYAETGDTGTVAQTGHDPDSPFEEAVAGFLREQGYDPVHQVGDGGFRIDIAVRDPRRPGLYMLAVECDGARYHSASSARERDRQRQRILEDKGWTFHRIWSTDWFHNREAEQERLLEACRAAEGTDAGATVLDVQPDPEVVPAATADADGDPDPPSVEEDADVSPPYVKAVEIGLLNADMDLLQAAPSTVDAGILFVVQAEGPVHQDVAIRRLVRLCGYAKTGKHLKACAMRAVNRLVNKRGLYRGGEGEHKFLSLPRQAVTVRDRSGLDAWERKAMHIPPSEVRVAILHAVENCVGVDAEGCVREAAGMFNVSVAKDFRALVEAQVRNLVKAGSLTETGGVLRLPG